jgi:multidrug resistance efflux pump
MNLRRLKSDLQIALSNLRVRMAEISERNRDSISDRIDRRVDYHRLVGEFHTKQARLEELNNTFATNESLRGGNAISDAEYVASKAAYEGLRAEIADLQAAIGVLEPEVNATEVDNVKELLQAEQARILDIQSELVEIESLIHSAQIVAPVDGRIVKRHCHAGEYVDSREPIVELLQSGSIEAVVYLPQHHASLLAINDEVQLVVTPLGEKQTFRVRRISPELVPPPQSLQANYRAFKGLVRVRAEPIDSANDLSRWVGAELALPRFAFRAPTYSESVMRQLGFATATSATMAKGE